MFEPCATDIAEGCLLVAESHLVASLGTLTRGLLESLFWTYWIAQSNENAQTYQNLGVNELKRIMRKNLATGYGKVVDKETQENKSQEILESPEIKSVPKRSGIEDIPSGAGLERLYTQIYGSMSMEAHGSTFGIWSEEDLDEKVFALLASANVFMECINLMVKNWMVDRKPTAVTDIYGTLGPVNSGAG